MRAVALHTPEDWAEAVAALPAAGALPARTVLVPSERHAHALRRSLSRSGRGAALAGTRFVDALTAAREVLASAGVPFSPDEDAVRPARLLALFREPLALEHFDPELLRETRGWDDAFARAIRTLEGAGLAPADLPDTPQARDLARVWTRAAAEAGSSWSGARVLAEAASVLERAPRAWPFDGETLAAVSGHEEAMQARFVRAIPRLVLGVWRAAPLGARHLERVERLFGAEARGILERSRTETRPSRHPGARLTERDLLAAYLFERAEVLAAPDRPRSPGPDGTVHLEEHAGVENEIEAAAEWVARKVLEERLPLEDVAVLVPAQDPLAGLVADRLARLPFEGGAMPVHVAGGVPAVSTAGGARVLSVVRALRSYLSADTVAAVLPALRLERPLAGAISPGQGDPGRSHLTHGEAMELAYSLGTVGGNAAHPGGAVEWSARAAAREGELAIALARARRDEDSASRETGRLERTLANLRAVRPAIDALAGVARSLVADAPLADLWDLLGAFLARWLLAPGESGAVPARLAEALAPACAGGLGRRLAGMDALAAVEERLLALRAARGRFGDPAVYVGTVAGAAGLDFGAVRVTGLCEGSLPSLSREDPLLPEALRARLEASRGCVLPREGDHAAAQVHALVTAVGGARSSVVLSAPRSDLARTEREPASLFVDAAVALARPDGTSGARAAPVPDGRALRRDAFRPARADAAAFRAAHPVSAAAWLDRVARVAPELPPAWSADPALALDRIAALHRPVGPLAATDGILGDGDPFPPLPGLDPARPISASALQHLLQCPRMFLMRRVLGWGEPAGAPPLRELDPPSFGSLLHRVLEEFYRAHGAPFAAREGTLAHWLGVALDVARAAFDAFLSEYPLVGEGVRRTERERLEESVRAFVAYDWGGPRARRFVGVELPFGEEVPLPVEADGVTLHVRGYVDRVDVEGDVTLVRDVKSGAPHPRRGAEEGPVPGRDVQIGLYALAARTLAKAWCTPPKVMAAYAYASGRGEVEERAFREDAAALEEATGEWLATAAHLLSHRMFPPSPDRGDCTFCPFRPLCGEEGPRRGAEGLAAAEDGPLARFGALKLDEEDEP